MKRRDHVPALKGKRLNLALTAIDKMPINKRAKAALQNLLVEAATPDRHEPEHATGREHGASIKATEAALTGLSQAKMAQAARLMAGDLDDDDWMDQMEQRLGDEHGTD